MSGLIGVEEQVDKDFHRALLKASLHRWRDRLCRDSAHERLLSFDVAKGALVHWSQAYRGMKTVEVEKITGSVGRCRDFDESFLPLRVSMAHRWGRVDRAYHKGVELPAVSLYKIGEAYFVRDGNHRVSVAKYHKAAAIDAEVVEIRGQIRTDVAQRPTGIAGAPTHRPQPAPEPNVSLLHSLWQHLRPGPLRPAPQRVLANLPRTAYLLATALFTLSFVGMLVACGVFFWYDTDFWYVFDVESVLKVAAALLSGFVVSSGLLFWHHQRQESYMTFESIFFLVCLFLSLLNLLWIAPVLFFL